MKFLKLAASTLTLLLISLFSQAALYPGSVCAPYQDRSSRSGYIAETATTYSRCQKVTQECINGVWVGPILYTSCVEQKQSCGGHPHGTTKTGYTRSTVPKGSFCPTGTKTCNNGLWIGPHLYPLCRPLSF